MGVRVILLGNVLKLHVFYSVLVPLRRRGEDENFKVSIFLKLRHYGISVYVMMLVFLMAMVKYLKALQIVKVTNTNHTKD